MSGATGDRPTIGSIFLCTGPGWVPAEEDAAAANTATAAAMRAGFMGHSLQTPAAAALVVCVCRVIGRPPIASASAGARWNDAGEPDAARPVLVDGQRRRPAVAAAREGDDA